MRIVREYDKEEFSQDGHDLVIRFMFDVLNDIGVRLYIHTDSVTNKVKIVASDGNEDRSEPHRF